MCFVRFFFRLFRVLNAFTVRVDELFDRALYQPFASPGVYAKAMECVAMAHAHSAQMPSVRYLCVACASGAQCP